MSTSLATMIRMRAIQNKTRQLFEGMSDLHYRLQFHHDLSPAGWHLGHGMFIENFWLHEIILGDNQYTKDKSLFVPENCPRPERGPRLPPLKQQLEQLQEQQDSNDLFLLEKIPPISDHPLFKDEYLENFLIQHYAQHYETINMVLNQIAIKNDKGTYRPESILESDSVQRQVTSLATDEYQVGGEWPMSYDNELPTHITKLNACHISITPVTNAEYLRFIESDAYLNESLWCAEGWQWRDENNITHPDHWNRNTEGQWYGINHLGAYDLLASDYVYGICHFEAKAFAKWAEARLPHEHEWETAVRLGQLTDTTKVWEWCCNRFYPYDDFKSFPYEEYSQPWFDNQHYVLKGASHHTRPEIKRASFRNFYQPHQRHIFAGLRLAFD